MTEDAVAAIEQARAVVEKLAAATEPAYGISTGFGALATRHIPAEMREQLQRSLVRSHAAGSGPEVEREVVRALMLLRLSTLATGHTGIRRETAELMAALLSAGITPVVREYGSLGCSGDLAPLSHCALALMGEGEVRDADGTLMPAADALAAAGLTPVELKAKEGLALINGTDGMLGMLVLAITDLRMLLKTADIAAAMSVEAQMGTDRVFAAELQELRPQVGQGLSAANLRAVLAGSGVMASHREDMFHRVQDAYSLRCSPQVHGAARDTVEHAATIAVPRAGVGRRQPGGRRRRGPQQRQLPRGAGRLRARLPRDRRGRRGLDQRAPVRPVPRQGPQPRPAAVPRRRPRRRQRPHDRAVHAGRHRLGDEAARRPGLRRLDPVVGHAGGPRVDGLERRAQAAPVRRRPLAGGRHRAAHRGAGARLPPAAARPAAGTGAVVDLLRANGIQGPGPDRYLSPEIEATVSLVQSGAVLAAVESTIGELAVNDRLPIHAASGTKLTAKSWQTEAPLRMLMNNLDPEVAERPGGPRRVRRHRQGRP